MFFTLIAISIMGIFIALFSPAYTTVSDRDPSIERIETVDAFLREVENSYAPLALRVSAYHALAAAISQVNETQTLLDDPHTELEATILNGTLGGTEILAGNRTFSALLAGIEARAQEAHRISLSITPNSINISDNGPWTIRIWANLSMTAMAGVANWTDEEVIITTTAPVTNLHDPLMLVGSGGSYGVRISPTGYIPQNLESFDAWVTSGNFSHVLNGQAPSFLERLSDSPQDSECCAIESAVRPDRISPSDQEESYIHHQFWPGEVPCENLYAISGSGFSHPGFKLDFTHAVRYNITDHASALTCP